MRGKQSVTGKAGKTNGLDCLTSSSHPIDPLTEIPALTNCDQRHATENAPVIAPVVEITPHHPVVDDYAPFTEAETEAEHADKAKGASS